jgi:hypothetical protein
MNINNKIQELNTEFIELGYGFIEPNKIINTMEEIMLHGYQFELLPIGSLIKKDELKVDLKEELIYLKEIVKLKEKAIKQEFYDISHELRIAEKGLIRIAQYKYCEGKNKFVLGDSDMTIVFHPEGKSIEPMITEKICNNRLVGLMNNPKIQKSIPHSLYELLQVNVHSKTQESLLNAASNMQSGKTPDTFGVTLPSELYLSSDLLFNRLCEIKAFTSNRRKQLDLSFLMNFKKIEHLDLRFSVGADYFVIQHLYNLRSLNLSYSDFSDSLILKQLTNLVALDLRGVSLKNLSGLTSLKNLRHLYLDDVIEQNVVDRFFEFSKLETFCALNSMLTSDHLGFLLTNKALSRVYLSNNCISDTRFLHSAKGIKELDLSRNPIDRIELEDYSTLEFLDLSYTRVKDWSFLDKCSNLKYLVTDNALSVVR